MKAFSFLLDTDWIIDHLNNISRATERIEESKRFGLAISVITLAELWEGVHFSTDSKKSELQLQKLLTTISVLGVTAETCQIFGRVRGTLRKQKKSVPDFDLMIAATALEHNLTLLSNNRKHFDSVEGLQLESL